MKYVFFDESSFFFSDPTIRGEKKCGKSVIN